MAFAACGPSQEAASASSAQDVEVSAIFIDDAPSGALSVAEGRTQLAPGDVAILKGQIGGVREPFLAGYAGFVLADSEIVFCNEMGEGDNCATPWDACCEDTDQLKARRVSVQFVDSEGNPLKADLKADSMLRELDHVVVVGKVAETSTVDNMIVNAEKLARLQ